jgi:hypothetical protein
LFAQAPHTQLRLPSSYSGAFLQSRRHHAHYFSNVDLFAPQNEGFNYLRYAKADEIPSVISKQPHLVMRTIGYDLVCGCADRE